MIPKHRKNQKNKIIFKKNNKLEENIDDSILNGVKRHKFKHRIHFTFVVVVLRVSVCE